MSTIIIQARNTEKTLVECLQALIHQEELQLEMDWDVILVDDGLTNRTV